MSDQHTNVEHVDDKRQPVVMLGDGRQVRCAGCRTDEHGLSKTQECDDHISFRFENVNQPGMNVVWKWSVLLNGLEVVDQTFEARAGEQDDGYIIGYVTVPEPPPMQGERRIVCQHSVAEHGVEGAHPLIEKRRGHVIVEQVPMPAEQLDPAAQEAARARLSQL
jgi:hypothetical protein